jgi:hypothetical protein
MSRMRESPVTRRMQWLVALSAFALAGVACAALVEVWVRAQWDERRGRPGFFLSDPVLGLRLAPGYEGWFAGTPVRINQRGFRDPREYVLEKSSATFRILVLGDSVTFGHGAIYDTTYPRLLEQRLHAWRPEVDWQVWNLGIPGLNTSQELAYLLEIGETYQPDVVVVGFFVNDFDSNAPAGEPGRLARAASFAARQLQGRLYSYEWYKRVYLTARWRLGGGESDLRRLGHLADDAALFAQHDEMMVRDDQQLTELDRFTIDEVEQFVCVGVPPPDPKGADEFAALLRTPSPEFSHWLEAVRGFHSLHATGTHHIVFFVNMAPDVCPGADRFYDAGVLAFDDVLVDALRGPGVPVVSSTRAFLHHRPSQMPSAGGHSLGNANAVKADVLFEFLAGNVLPGRVSRTR